jgi:hypothetical protein
LGTGSTNREGVAGDALRLLSYASDIGSVELKLTVPAARRLAMRNLSLDTLQGRIREVVFFDTPDLTLYQSGVVVRARRTQGKPEDTVVKLRPLPDRLPPELRTSPDMKIEMDVTAGGSYVVSASLKGLANTAVRKAVDSNRSVDRLFTKTQRDFFATYKPADVNWSDLIALGPIFVVVLRYQPTDFSRRVTVEQWHYPGEVPLVELSTKAAPAEISDVREEAVEWLTKHELAITDDQEPKTRKALEFYARGAEEPSPKAAATSTT